MKFISSDQATKIETLRNNDYFSSLDDAAFARLSDGMTLRRFEPGESIFWHDDPCGGLYLLQRGSVKLFRLSPKGRELIITVFHEGATFNEVPVFDRGANAINVAALEECEIWVVDAEAVRACTRQHPMMAQAVILNLCKNLRMLVGTVEELSFCQVTNRLARLISRLPLEQLQDQRTTQDQLAAHLGTVREVVARSLRDLERSGAIQVRRGRIKVINPAILQDWAEIPSGDSPEPG
ncbi:MAG: Crp/Fnr family transcriptional regulator [Anaerolineales bacterium]|nr:Crp/Fnr family transcriptional regulator [Anaerolineales bacterium]